MNLNVETVIVGVVVAVAMAWGIRAIYRSCKKGTVCSSCGDSGDCPLTSQGQDLTELKDFDPNNSCSR